MKPTCFQSLHRIMLLAAIITAMCCIGCANIDDVLKAIEEPPEGDGIIITDMPIGEIEVLLTETAPFKLPLRSMDGYRIFVAHTMRHIKCGMETLSLLR